MAPEDEDEGEHRAVQPVAAGERRDLLFADGDGDEVKQVDVEGEGDEGGDDFLVASLARLAARKQGQGEGVDEERDGGVAAALPFA